MSEIRNILFLVLISHLSFSQQLQWHEVKPQTDASFRALSVIDDQVAWVAGTKGWVGQTTNGGKDWTFLQVKGFEKFDFRSLYAFDKNVAVIANAGAPANILYTRDSGRSWNVVYTNSDTAAFFDGIDFWNEKQGLIYGDGIQGKMLVLRTEDGGLHWEELTATARPTLANGEASFAASGTNIRCAGRSSVVIGTGGRVSRLWVSEDKGTSWKTIDAPILQGESATGIFSFSGFKGKDAVIVGGDYTRDTLKMDHVFYTRDAGKTWLPPKTPTRGYRECVEYLDANTLIATGPGGTDISLDGGISWIPESDEKSFHVVRKARKGNLIIIAGGQGKISILNK